MVNHRTALEKKTTDGSEVSQTSNTDVTCPVSKMPPGLGVLSKGVSQALDEAGCPLAGDMHRRLAFETLLSELSAKFVNVPASQVDSQIEWGLRRVVELLEIDRCGLGQVSPDRQQLVVTHSYQLPGVPPSAKLMLDSDFPEYARMIHQGMVIRLPDDMPPDETPSERVLPSNRAEIQFDHSTCRARYGCGWDRFFIFSLSSYLAG